MNEELLKHFSDEAWEDPIQLMKEMEKHEESALICEEIIGVLQTEPVVKKLYLYDEVKVLIDPVPIDTLIRRGILIPAYEIFIPGRGVEKCYTQEAIDVATAEWQKTPPEDSDLLYKRFIDMFSNMKMLYSYKPLLMKAIFRLATTNGEAALNDIAEYFLDYFAIRRENGQTVEKRNSVFSVGSCSKAKARRTIITYPYERFRRIGMLSYHAQTDSLAIPQAIWKRLTPQVLQQLDEQCNVLLDDYFSQL